MGFLASGFAVEPLQGDTRGQGLLFSDRGLTARGSQPLFDGGKFSRSGFERLASPLSFWGQRFDLSLDLSQPALLFKPDRGRFRSVSPRCEPIPAPKIAFLGNQSAA